MNQVKLNSEKIFVKYTQLFTIFFSFCLISLSAQDKTIVNIVNKKIIPGAEQPEKYVSLLLTKKIGVVTNQTGITILKTVYSNSDDFKTYEKPLHADTISIVDFLISKNISIEKIFSPEHGFRGNADAGEQIKNGKDLQTGISIISLYGKNKKPTPEQLKNIDILLFDIQDVGVRFYTYISTLHYIMEAAAENNIPVIVLDRPNPNGHYVDGPILKKGFESFVGMHKVPIVYGMTIGEYAQMINGEKWLNNGIICDLTIIPLKNYNHSMKYSLPVAPSPNLKTDRAINLYPSICFFEGTNISEGRGTDFPFEVYGSPFITAYNIEFVPQPKIGAKSPRYQGQICYGEDLRDTPFQSQINLQWLLTAYFNSTNSTNKPTGYSFFNKNLFFDKLAGTDQLRKQIVEGKTEIEIKNSWKKDLEEFKLIREKYLMYP